MLESLKLHLPKMRLTSLAALALLALIAVPAFADLNNAKAAYLRGLAKEKARDYQAAIAEYETALAQYPSYFYANKQLGNCFYYTGDHAKSLKSYDAYLVVKPDDAATRAFADRLRPEVEHEEDELAPRRGRRRRHETAPQDRSPESGAILGPSFYLGGSINWLTSGGDDLKQVYPSGSNVSVSNFTLYEDVHLGWQFQSGLAVEAGFEYLARAATATYVDSYGYLGEDGYFDTESVFYIEPMYRFPLSRLLAVSAGAKLGYASDSLSASSSYSYYSGDNFTGTGTLIAPEARLQILPGGRVGLELGAEYRMDDISPMKGVFGTAVNSSGGIWHMNNGGLALRFGLNIYFSRLTRS